ncbi:MAG: InlB B-repeat-containing protein [Clostridiales Family XIII bacterium]|nr:InlB B-repeat-containing protein [Clostridiales Family XIII bacterium]
MSSCRNQVKHERAGRLLSVLLILALALTLSFPPAIGDDKDAVYAASDAEAQAALDGANSWIKSKTPAPQFGSVGGEWAVLALARSGAPVPAGYYQGYVGRVEKKVRDSSSAILDASKSTENERLILALSALGVDATSFGGKDIVAPLTQDLNWMRKQGINGSIFALIALDAKPYFTNGDATRSQIISFLLSKEEGNPYGWSLDGAGSQKVDITAMTLQALAPYYTGKRTVSSPSRADIQAAVTRALNYLSSVQTADGGISGNSESCAQTIAAMCSLGMDPNSSTQFVKNGKTLVDGLLSYRDASSGGFRHAIGGAADGMATEQAAYAFAAYTRFKSGKTGLYDMSDAFAAAPLVTPAQRLEEAKKLDGLNIAVYDVTFDANGGRFGTENNAPNTKAVSQTEGKKYSFPSKPVLAAYTFTGWYTRKSGGKAVTSNTVVKGKNKHTLWAHWAVTKKALTYNANKGKLTVKGKKVKSVKKTATYGKRYAPPKSPTRKGYKFKGWYTKKYGGSKVTKSTKVAFYSGKWTLWARWEKR